MRSETIIPYSKCQAHTNYSAHSGHLTRGPWYTNHALTLSRATDATHHTHQSTRNASTASCALVANDVKDGAEDKGHVDQVEQYGSYEQHRPPAAVQIVSPHKR
eukprot:6187505-Pleurochrysis_carterae.AAC.1